MHVRTRFTQQKQASHGENVHHSVSRTTIPSSSLWPPVSSRGFSLIEALVAIIILLTAITGTLTITRRGLVLSDVARDNVIVFYLAQEPIEELRAIRDSNKLDRVFNSSGVDWLAGMNACLNQDCRVDGITGTLTTCAGVCPVVRFNQSDGRYGYNGTWDATHFTRTVRLTEPVDEQEAEIVVTVTWPARNTIKTFELRERMFNW